MSLTTSNRRPRVLIEEWLPAEELGTESRRERGASICGHMASQTRRSFTSFATR